MTWYSLSDAGVVWGIKDTRKAIPALVVLIIKCRTGPEMDGYNPIPKLVEKCLPTVKLFHLG